MAILLVLLMQIGIQMTTANSVYDIEINSIEGESLDWNDFKGKKILIVNVASECGYTPQYAELQELHEMFGDRLTVLGVPCNDFGGQEPGSAEQIKHFCSTKYRVTFPMTEKVGIIKDTHPLYKFLTQSSLNGKKDYEVKWNFTKFLLDENGVLIDSFSSGVAPMGEEILSYFE